MADARYIDSLKNPKIAGFEWQDPQNDEDRKIFRHILESGYCGMHNTPDEPFYVFSVGLYLNFLHPEILVMGLSHDVSQRAILRICDEIEAGRLLNVGDERADLFEVDFPVRFRAVEDQYYFDNVSYAAWFYRSLLFKLPRVGQHKFPVLQAIWADKNGYYPNDPRCSEVARQAQTLKLVD